MILLKIDLSNVVQFKQFEANRDHAFVCSKQKIFTTMKKYE